LVTKVNKVNRLVVLGTFHLYLELEHWELLSKNQVKKTKCDFDEKDGTHKLEEKKLLRIKLK
jgi:hypothetical protein